MFSKSAAAVAILTATSFGADFFPLEQGNYWRYRSTTTGDTLEVRVGTPVFTHNQVYYLLRGYTPNMLLVRLDDKHNLVYLDEERGMEVLLTSFEANGRWDAPQRICHQTGATGTQVEKDSHRELVEVNYITTGCADAGTTNERFAENIGMVQRTATTIAGPRVYDLIEARVGKLSLNNLPNGSFTVSVTPDGRVTLKLTTDPVIGLKLKFANGQEYDVMARDVDGKVLWRWSAGVGFIQAEHEITVAGEWRATIQLPKLEATAYSIEGWLTTTEDSPHFGAVIPATTSYAQPKHTTARPR